jgi:hypothetical protein
MNKDMNKSIRYNSIRQNVIIFILIMPVLFIPSIMLYAHTESTNPSVFPPSSRPYGLTYGEWSAKWWQWAESIPKENNPAADETGQKCSQSQNGPVWYLAGTRGGPAVRDCTIPAGKAILFPIINGECSYAEFPSIKTESELRACAKADQDKVRSIEATVDGVKLKDLQKYRVQSPLFSITLPKDNVLGLEPQTTQAVGDGYYIILQPLSSGKHTVHFSGVLGDPSSSPFVTDATYNLNVQ